MQTAAAAAAAAFDVLIPFHSFPFSSLVLSLNVFYLPAFNSCHVHFIAEKKGAEEREMRKAKRYHYCYRYYSSYVISRHVNLPLNTYFIRFASVAVPRPLGPIDGDART